jgi:Aspartate oxidase
VVVGSGIAGLSFALKAAQHGSVAVITKRKGADSNTAWAQGGIACVTSDEDSFELHVRDTLEAGAGLCDEKVVRTIVTEGPEAIRELMDVGVHFDERDVFGHRELDLGREGGHSKRRVLHVQDVTGREIENKLLAALGRSQEVQLLENHTAIDLITAAKLGFATEDRCLGLYSLDEKTGNVETIRSDRVVLATGGCGQSLSLHHQPRGRDWRRGSNGMARRGCHRKHGVRAVPSDLPFSSRTTFISDFRSRPWRRRNFAGQPWRGFHAAISPARFAGPARCSGTCD